MPEGDQVCKLCREQEKREMTPEERLLRALFTKADTGVTGIPGLLEESE